MSTSILDTPGMNKHTTPRLYQRPDGVFVEYLTDEDALRIAADMTMSSASLFAISDRVGRTKSWLRAHGIV